MKQYKKSKKLEISVWTILALISIGLISSAYGQEIKDNLNEDQVIICVNGHIIDMSGDICKVFNVDDISLLNAQEELYKEPNNDTFNMVVID